MIRIAVYNQLRKAARMHLPTRTACKKILLLLLAVPLFLAHAQQPVDPAADANSKKAHQLLDQMVQALGGDRWLNLTSWHTEGQLAGFDYHGRPELATLPFWDFNRVITDAHGQPQLQERVELSKHRDDVELFLDNQAWELTFKGKVALPKEASADYFTRRAHSIFTIAHLWRTDPRTLFLSEGQSMVERRLADKITLISADNLTSTIELDASSHLPLRLTFTVQNTLYGDKDEIAEEYDDYHTIQDFPTPFRITRIKNGDPVRQTYVARASYGDAADPLLYDVDHTEKSKKK
jgi:hypothetical protein